LKDRRIHAPNLAELYRRAADQYEELPAFATRNKRLSWKPVSFRELFERGLEVTTGLIDCGVERGDPVGLFADNRFEWILSDCGIQCAGAVNVPRGTDSTDEELLYIVNHASIRVAIVEDDRMLARFRRLRDQMPALRTLIVMESESGSPTNSVSGSTAVNSDLAESGKTVNSQRTPGNVPETHSSSDGALPEDVRSLEAIRRAGAELRAKGDRRAEERLDSIQPEDLFTIIYTSGTTGRPKGVMLSHSNMMSQTRVIPILLSCTDRVLSILPVWHIFERVFEVYTISCGACTYYSGVRTLAEDLKDVEPTFMGSAPRLWESLYQKIREGITSAHPVRRALFHTAYFLSYHYKTSRFFLAGTDLQLEPQAPWKRLILWPAHLLRLLILLPWYGFFNAAVLETIRQSAGGSIKATISGGGALPAEIDRFFNFIGIPVLEGYGLTETSPVVSARTGENLVVGTVGPPVPGTDVRIIDPETENQLYPDSGDRHNGRGRRGEIWIRGPQVMKGYYREPELTATTLRDGWLRTGDIGMMTFNGCLRILGRYKATVVLTSGENLEPEPIEMRLQQSPLIENCMVIGQDQKQAGVLIVPNMEGFKGRVAFDTLEDLAANPEALNLIRQEVRALISARNGFKPYEFIRHIRLLSEPFEVGNELTSLYKLRRHVVEQKYADLIREIYSPEPAIAR